MAKKDQVSDKEPKVLADSVKRVKDDWDKKRNGSEIMAVTDPRSNSSILITKIEFDDVKVSLWTGDYSQIEPEYVIVNPPTQVPNSNGGYVEDPMTAIAMSIIGVTQ